MKNVLRKLIRPLIIAIGLVILVYPSLSEYLSQKNSSRVISSYDDSVVRLQEENKRAILTMAREYNQQLLSFAGYQRPRTDESGLPISLSRYDDILSVGAGGMMGYLSIPKLKETIPIYHGTSEEVLQVGVGHLENTSLPVGGPSTHAALSGHRGLPNASLFTDLDQVAVGDRFYLKILDETLCYTVDQIVTVLPGETEELAIQAGEDYVTLITCTPYGVNSHRLLVRGTRTPYFQTAGDELDVMEVEDTRSFFEQLPAQYRHMLIGAAVIVVFLIVRRAVIIIRYFIRKGREPEHADSEAGK